MSGDVVKSVDGLDDKQAIYVAQKLSQAIFERVKPPDFDTIAKGIDNAFSAGGLKTDLAKEHAWRNATLRAGAAGNAARATLRAWAEEPGLAPAVAAAIEQFKTSKQDLGIFSVPLALGLTYALLAMDLDLDLGFVKIKKQGLSGKQQADVVKKTIKPVLKAIGVDAG